MLKIHVSKMHALVEAIGQVMTTTCSYERYKDEVVSLYGNAWRDKILTKDEFTQVEELAKNMKYRVLICDTYVDGNHPTGVGVVKWIREALGMQRAGLNVRSWYGPAGEVLVIGIVEGVLELTE